MPTTKFKDIEPAALPPIFVSVKEAARALSSSEWFVKDALRRRLLRAKKNGRRTPIEYASVLELAASLPEASFAAPRRRRGAP